MATINQHPSGVADWATICAWIHENRPDLWEGLGPADEDRAPAHAGQITVGSRSRWRITPGIPR